MMSRKSFETVDPDDSISSVVDVVSFDETLGEIERVAGEGLSEDRTIPVNSVEVYEVIAEFGRMIRLNRMVRVDTKYKTMDRKVRPVPTPLQEENWE